MPRRKKERGRPMTRKYPPRAEASAEEIAQAFFAMPADHKWQYKDNEPEYRCPDCQREVGYPDTLYSDGRCEECHKAVAAA